MRHVKRDNRTKPQKLKDPLVLTTWETLASTKNKKLIKASFYADPYSTFEGKRSRVIDVLDKWYYYKCAYCEKTCKADVEHYRPSKSVKDLSNIPVKGHSGYYWLCYEWSNLIPSCANCNREGAKYDKFPVLGTQINAPIILPTGILDKKSCAIKHSYLKKEKPVLLHPEIDYPELFFEFEIDPKNEGIKIVGTDSANRGSDSIKICLLNRKELKVDRHKQVVLDFVDSIHAAFNARANNIIPSNPALVREIYAIIQALYNKSKNDQFTHTLLRKFIVKSPANFKKIIIPYIEVKYQPIVLKAFLNYTPY